MRALSYDEDARPASIAEMRALLDAVPGMGAAVCGPSTVKFTVPQGGAQTQLLWKFKSGDEVRSSPALREKRFHWLIRQEPVLS